MSPTPAVPDLPELTEALEEHLATLRQFWMARAVDSLNGGYQTNFDPEGTPEAEDQKYLLSHTRLLWSFSALAEEFDDPELLTLATHGFDYLVENFYDAENHGWHWKLDSHGGVIDPAKLVYGQSFAIYAFAKYANVTRNARALELATDTFDALIHHAADTAWGGFFENLDGEWAIAGGGGAAGDRKSLDIHMHLLEAFTELALASGDPLHLRRLAEVRELLLTSMIDPQTGVGGNQYDARFTPIPPIVIAKTWIAERTETEAGSPLTPVTSYGHNLELGWLLTRANEVLGLGEAYDADLVRATTDHALAYGYDSEFGGVYREGPEAGPASDQDKEFWQNSESLVGFLNAYQLTGDARYFEAFRGTWEFSRAHLIHPELGEWRIRSTREGEIVDGALGNHWTGGYHTIRAALESVQRLRALGDG